MLVNGRRTSSFYVILFRCIIRCRLLRGDAEVDEDVDRHIVGDVFVGVFLT